MAVKIIGHEELSHGLNGFLPPSSVWEITRVQILVSLSVVYVISLLLVQYMSIGKWSWFQLETC